MTAPADLAALIAEVDRLLWMALEMPWDPYQAQLLREAQAAVDAAREAIGGG